MSRPDAATIERVKERGAGRCEYCHFPRQVSALPFQIDHIIAQKHDGTSDESNLAFACYHCNSFKGPNIAGVDPVSGEIARLFHPRRDDWNGHFMWRGAWLFGRTAIARCTIQVLSINNPESVAVRESLMDEGCW